MPHTITTSRRGFLAGMGMGAVGIAAAGLVSPATAGATTVPRSGSTTIDGFKARNHPTYRARTFRRGKTFTSGNRSFTVKRRKAIPGVTGERQFDRNAFEVIFDQTKGPETSNGTLTLTPEKGQPFDLHLTDQGSGTYSAVINRYKEV